jgi:DNA-binding PadR family transcriptional regulator
MTLDRLEKKGLLESSLTAPTPERGGRAKRCYRVTKPALAALRASRRALVALWEGLGN